MRKLQINENMTVTNILEVDENLRYKDGFRYLSTFDENAQIGDVMDFQGNIVINNNVRYVPSETERQEHYDECIRNGTYTLDDNGELCPIVPRNS